MGYQPIYDGEFDLGIASSGEELIDLLESISRHKLVLTEWVTDGPAGGNPMIKLRGTRRQFIGWLDSYYDMEKQLFERSESDAQTWLNAQECECFILNFVA